MASSSEGCDKHVVDSEEFASTLTKQAVAHICVALGFTLTTPGALECLTDVAQQYLEDMAKRTMESTHRAGRTEANLADVLQGLQQMPIPVHWTELRDFAFSEDGRGGRAQAVGAAGEDGSDEVVKRWDHPFHNTVPSFPLPRKRPALWDELDEDASGGKEDGAGGAKQGREGAKQGRKLRAPHLPPFAPSLPASAGSMATERSGKKLGEIRLERLMRQRQSEKALRNLGVSVTLAEDDSNSFSSAYGSESIATGGSEGGALKKAKGKGKRPIGALGSLVNGPVRSRADSAGSGTREEKKPRLSLKFGNGVVMRANQQGIPSGFRSIPPNAAGASMRLGSSESRGVADGAVGGSGSGGVANGLSSKVSGGGPRGAFGRPSDSTREERILEGIPPDGPQGDVDGAA